MEKAYITTAIPYLNGEPHVGHAMDFLLADIMQRYLKSQDRDVRLQIGADEHGSKIDNKAKEKGIPTQEFVDQNWAHFKSFIDLLAPNYTDIVRTTDQDHMRHVQAIWQQLDQAKLIYKGTYEGWYCEGCEAFVTQTEYEATGGVCPDHKKPYTKLSEDNYYLDIASKKAELTALIEDDTIRIIPEFRKREFLNLLKDMPDVSISRPKSQLQWGVEVPGDDSQVMYVWVDALSNYATVLGYPDNDISEWWPPYAQIIGKDILRFHAGIWQVMLLGLGLPTSPVILTHGHLTLDGDKMSKSLGNVVGPLEIIDKYGVEAFRYYFGRHVSTTDDSDFTWDKMHRAYDGELKNDLGNLVQRLSTMCAKAGIAGKDATASLEDFDRLMQNFQYSTAFDLLWSKVQDLNKAIDVERPWELAKSNPARQIEVLTDLATRLVSLAHLLEIFLPDTSAKILEIFTAEQITPPQTPLFPPIEA